MGDLRPDKSAHTYIGLLLISIAVLTSQILLIRVLSFIFLHFFAYMVIGLTLLGFSAAGTLLAVYPSLLQKDSDKRLAILAFLFSAMTPITYYLSIVPAPYATTITSFVLYLFFVFLVMTAHFFFAGLVIAYLFMQRPQQITRLYFVNLVGSGIGCFILIQLIRSLGGEGLILLVTSIGAFSAVFFGIGFSKKFSSAALVFAVAALCLLPLADDIFRLSPTFPGKQMHLFVSPHKEAKTEYQAWDPVARVDVVDFGEQRLHFPDKLPFKYAFNDASAGSFLLGIDKPFPEVNFADWNATSLPFWIKEEPEVLIIGLGGAPDVLTALHYKAKQVYGVEISERMIEIARDRFQSFLNFPYQQENVEIAHDEGRSYVRRMNKKVDIIQMTGVDTAAAQFGGNFVLVENYLYTVEAFKEYLEHLNEDGVLSITRFVFNTRYPERALRSCSVGVQALRELGVEHPEQNFIVINCGIFLTTMIKKTAYTKEETQAILDKLDKLSRELDPSMDPMPFLKGVFDIRYREGRRLLYLPDQGLDIDLSSPDMEEYLQNLVMDFRGYFAAVAEDKEESFIAKYVWNITPCTDNRPFFFMSEKWEDLFRGRWAQVKERPPIGFFLFMMQVLWVTLLTLVLVLVPLYSFRRRGLQVRGRKTCILYFSCLGIGFMLVEIWLMQKFLLFLGHPTYSISVILFSLLVASGLGSLVSGMLRLSSRNIILLSILSIAGILFLYSSILDPIFLKYLKMPLHLRMALSVSLLAPLGFVMGMPFPTGLRILEKHALSFIPWAWAINGSASVVATFLSCFIGVPFGFSTMILCAIVTYLTGMLFMINPKTGLVSD